MVKYLVTTKRRGGSQEIRGGRLVTKAMQDRSRAAFEKRHPHAGALPPFRGLVHGMRALRLATLGAPTRRRQKRKKKAGSSEIMGGALPTKTAMRARRWANRRRPKSSYGKVRIGPYGLQNPTARQTKQMKAFAKAGSSEIMGGGLRKKRKKKVGKRKKRNAY